MLPRGDQLTPKEPLMGRLSLRKVGPCSRGCDTTAACSRTQRAQRTHEHEVSDSTSEQR